MKFNIEKLKKLKNKPYWHYLCYAGSTVSRVDKWGEKEIYLCPHKGKDDWGKVTVRRDESLCKRCDGKLKGFLDLTDYEGWENVGIDRAISLLNKEKI